MIDANRPGGARYGFLRPQVAGQVDLHELHRAAHRVIAKFEPAIIERPQFGQQALGHILQLRQQRPILDQHQRIVARVDQAALFFMTTRAMGVGRHIHHRRQYPGLPAAAAHDRDRDVEQRGPGFDQHVMPLPMQIIDLRPCLGPVVDHRQPPGRRGGVRLDHQPIGVKSGFGGQAAPAEQLRRHGRHAMGAGDHLAEIFVIRHAAQDRACAQMRHIAPAEQQRCHHLAILEPASIKQGDDEIHVRSFEQRFIAVGDADMEADLLHRRAHFVMIDGVVAIHRVGRAGCARMFGEEEDTQSRLVGRRYAHAAVDRRYHAPSSSPRA